MSKHTPGPWTVERDKHGVARYWLRGPSGVHPNRSHVEHDLGPFLGSIGNGTTAEHSIERATANARLIAAAPDMLEALEGLLDLLKETEPNGFPEGTWAGRQIEAAVAALAKARGEA